MFTRLTLSILMTAAISAATPLLTLTVNSISIAGSGSGAYLGTGAVPPANAINMTDFFALPLPQQTVDAQGSLFSIPGPAQRVLVWSNSTIRA